MEYNSKGISLTICTTANGTFQKLYGLKNTPDMGGDKEKLDVTNLDDSHIRNINGIADYGDLAFEFWYNKETDADAQDAELIKNSYSVLKAYETAGTKLYWKLTYPDGTGCSWLGEPAVKRAGVGVNEALAFTVTTSIESTITDFNAPCSGLTVTSAAGTTTGYTDITVSPAVGAGHGYVYKTAASVTVPREGDICSTDYDDWDGDDEIAATTGNKILIVEIDSNSHALKAGVATVTSA